MSEVLRVSLDAAKMFPEAARRVKVLEQLQRSWATVVGPRLARHSYPYNLGVDELCVAVRNATAESMLRNSAGTVARKIAERFGYVFAEPFKLTIGEKIPVPKKQPVKKAVVPEVAVDEEKVRQYMQGAPDTLPEDINYALSHLRAYLEARFG
ncbi:MAG: DUF721 domain-containing protein [Synergistaceae bacterium]|nr:DUF721 domain-containing protein [Synergistaceae bacterium]